jgi:hypothetical protein
VNEGGQSVLGMGILFIHPVVPCRDIPDISGTIGPPKARPPVVPAAATRGFILERPATMGKPAGRGLTGGGIAGFFWIASGKG